MDLLFAISCLLAAFLPCICNKRCSNIYGKYDQGTLSKGARDETFLSSWRNVIPINIERGEKTQFSERKECPELYQRYSADHTFCKKSTCSIIQKGVTEDEKNTILKFHNSLRSKLASGKEARYSKTPLPSAANMMQLEWDNELAAVAEAHAELCLYDHDANEQRAVENFPVGQNLMQYNGDIRKWGDADMWYKDEVCFYSPQYNSPFNSGDFGHFSQVTWATTWKIGCGFTSYRKDGSEKALYTCNYGPAGNVPGGRHYIVGKPCSQCPPNTECSTEYPGLCKSKTSDGPQMKRPSSEDFILFCDFSQADPEECKKVKVSGSREFSTRHIYTGDYKTVVLNAGESISIDVGKAQNTGGICPFVYARFGPNNAKDPVGSVVEIQFSAPNIVPMPPSTVTPLGSFFVAGTHMMYDGELQSVLTLKAEQGAKPQYFDVKAWGVRKGSCGTSLGPK